MGRTNGKLIYFLRTGLMHDLYENLNYDDGSDTTFHIELPRYDKGKSMGHYEKILKAWYDCNGKQYKNYSVAKAVFQANLKKSVYLVSDSTSVKKLRFHFADDIEIEENKRRMKEKEKDRFKNSVVDSSDELDVLEADNNTSSIENVFPIFDHFPNNPLSVQSSSSGYSTGEEVDESPIDLDFSDWDFMLDTKVESNDLNLTSIQIDDKLETDDLNLLNIQVEDLFKPVPEMSLHGVQEINFTPVDVSQYLKKKTYWLCNKKLNLGSILQLICEKQILEDGNSRAEGSVVISNEVWEPGISYDLKKSFELDEKLFLLLAPRV